MNAFKTATAALAVMLATGSYALAQATQPSTQPKPAMPAAPAAPAKPAAPAAAAPAAPAAATAKPATPMAKKVNINSATAEQLDALPQIGEKRSEAIIKGRPYKTTDELVTKKVLSQGIYDKIKDSISVK